MTVEAIPSRGAAPSALKLPGVQEHPKTPEPRKMTLAERLYLPLIAGLGVTIRLGRPAELLVRGDAVAGAIVDGREIEADAVLVAAGPWSPGIVDPLGRWRPIQSRWGTSS